QGAIRRALMAFDVAASLPAGAVVQSAALQITVEKTIAGSKPVSVHRVQQDWGEGTSVGTGSGGSSKENDATWIHTFFDGQTWQTPGGDYDPGTLTSGSAGTGTALLPSTDDFVSLVQTWLDSPDQNFGVILIGDENSSPSTKAIGSRENTGGDAPQLQLTYSMATATRDDQLPGFLTSLYTFPNPASNLASIAYELRDSRDVRIDVFDVTGRIVATPVSSVVPAGMHVSRIDTRRLSPGLYGVVLRSGDQSVSKTIVVQ
ncbi:MAG: DNRLRE domain-containing protein, partial [Rhodothermales bacterium]